ncbi:MAG: hypothetical protein IJ946_02340 [Clostridia bacterium]|nr:hypothetical protein [Clostridia bacterium]
MKKLTAVILATLLLFCGFNAYAENGVSLIANNAAPQNGDTVVFTVTFTCPSYMNAFSYTVSYDPAALDFVSTSAQVYNAQTEGVIYYALAGNSRITTETFTFCTKTVGETEIKVTDILSADSNEYSYPDTVYSLKVLRPTRGDVDDNGKVDTSDLAALKLYLAGIGADINNQYADMDSNEQVDTSDLAALKLYLAGIKLQ